MKKHFSLSAVTLLVILGLCAGSVSAQTWTAQTSGVTTSLNTVSAVDQNVGGVVLRTTDGGSTWTDVGGSPIGTADIYAIYGLDANTCLLTTSPSATNVYRTTDGGTTWTEVFTQAGGFMDDFEFMDANTGLRMRELRGIRQVCICHRQGQKRDGTMQCGLKAATFGSGPATRGCINRQIME